MNERRRPLRFLPATDGLRGTVSVPGDKSISHRAVLLGAVNSGPLRVRGFLPSADTAATVAAVRALGVTVEEPAASELVVHGRGWEGLAEPADVIDVANSGTLIRLLPGLVASCPFVCIFTGDASIRRRPMARILEPLATMGATVLGRGGDALAPFAVRGGPLRGIRHELSVASAQVKSCLLLAGLRAEGETTVVEPAPSRDHTERLLRYGGAVVIEERTTRGGRSVKVQPVTQLLLPEVRVPGDFSSAAFFVVGAVLTPNSALTVEGVGLNPTRTGLLTILERMGADIEVRITEEAGPEPLGQVVARTSSLEATEVTPEEVPSVIDELPLFLLAAAKAHGVSRVRGAGELRAKESDRLQAMASLLRSLAVEVRESPEGMEVVGRPQGWAGGEVAAFADHRIAMVGAIAGAASREGVWVDDTECVAVSFPEFMSVLGQLGGGAA